MSEICPYCGTRNPGKERCGACGGLLDDLSLTATQIAMGPWYFRLPGKPYGPGCDLDVLQRLIAAGKIKAPTRLRGPGTAQLWRRAAAVPGIAHLLGHCHACGVKVKPDSKFCHECGQKFEPPDHMRDELGIPGGDPAATVEAQRRADASTCPRCGATLKDGGDECPECEAVFAPADEATPHFPGPWFIHGKAHEYFPGISFERLKREIAVDNVTARTIVRGPTTQQFWKLAKETPGVAHLVGFCHACGESADAADSTCRACGKPFGFAADDQHLGLRYPTPQVAAAAQEELDRELARLNAEQGPAAPLEPLKKQQEYQSYDKLETIPEPHADEHEAYEAHDVWDVASMPDYVDADAAGQAEPAHAAAGGAGEEDVAAVVAAATGTDSSAAADRRNAAAQLQNNKNLLVTASIAAVVLLGGLFIIMNSGGKGDKPGDGAATKKDAAATDDPAFRVQATDQLKKLRADARRRWEGVKDWEKAGQLGTNLAAAELQFKEAERLFAGQKFLESDASYRKFLDWCDKAETIKTVRDAAAQSRTRALAAAKSATEVDAPKHATKLFDEAETTANAAKAHFEQDRYDDARRAWEDAVEQYGAARQFVQDMRAAADARASVEADVYNLFPRETLEQIVPGNWAGLRAKLDQGDTFAADGKYPEAMDYYDQARKMIPGLRVEMQHILGRKWYCYQAGRLTTRILLPKSAGHHPDEEMLAKLKAAYTDMMINRDFFNRIPLNPDCSYDDLATVMLIATRDEITTTFPSNEGVEAQKSFNIGVNFVIVEKFLRTDPGRLTPATYDKLILAVNTLKDDIPAAGWGRDMTDFINDFENTLKGERDNFPNRSRAAWTEMTQKLEEYDTAIKLVGQVVPDRAAAAAADSQP